MNANELFQTGRLQEAIDAQVQAVKAAPGDNARRLFLFELLTFAGDLARARRQIDAMQHDDLALDAATAVYRRLLDVEEARQRVFAAGEAPKFFGEPPAYARLQLDGLARLREQKPDEAADLLDQAAAASPALRGRLNDKPFTSLRDWDDRFGTVLEVMTQDSYYWVPLEQVAAVTVNPPKYPRDLLWLPANLQMRSGQTGGVFLPALYPGTSSHADDLVRLGRGTDWPDEGPAVGAGVHLWRADDDSTSLLDWRQLDLG